MTDRQENHSSAPRSDGRLYAVLTGDIVGSTRLAEQGTSRISEVLPQTSQTVRQYFDQSVPLAVDIFRGDSWQMLFTEPRLGLRAALLFRALLISSEPSMDTRVAIAIGAVDHIPSERASEGQGEAYRLSGRKLEALKKPVRMGFSCADEREEATWDTVVQLVDALMTLQCTRPRAIALTGVLRDMKQEDTGRLWGDGPIAQGSVSKHLRGIGWGAISTALRLYEKRWR